MRSIMREVIPSESITTISPGFTSRTKFAPTASSAQLSLATTMSSSTVPIHSGRMP